MNHQCDNCHRRATHHSVEVRGGKKISKHLCDVCAAEAGLAIEPVHASIHEMLGNFQKIVQEAAPEEPQETSCCPQCGLAYAEFREARLLGCPDCYEAFAMELEPLLQRAHAGGSGHIGKVPRRAGAGEHRQKQLMRLRKQLDDAVREEAYERAAKLRDEIGQLEAPSS